jgi:hypothetical protein
MPSTAVDPRHRDHLVTAYLHDSLVTTGDVAIDVAVPENSS